MKRSTVGLYNPYLDTLGGGEKHILSILEVLAKEQDSQVTIFWPEDLSKSIAAKLDLRFPSPVHFESIPFYEKTDAITRLRTLSDYDLLLYVTDGSYFVSSAKQTAIFCMVPNPELYRMHLMNRMKTAASIFISNSQYTQSWLARWGVQSTVIYPYVSGAFFQEDGLQHAVGPQNSRPVILTVGRFFESLHSKRQDLAIETFQQLQSQDERFHDAQLVLAGSVDEADRPYLDRLQTMIGDNPQITLAVNPPFSELLEMYRKARYFWHFAGYGIDEQKAPHRVEHLGITPLEAMASQTLTCCYRAGGPTELITHGENGILFSSQEELIQQMIDLQSDEQQSNTMIANAYSYVKERFSYGPFAQRVIEVFQPYL